MELIELIISSVTDKISPMLQLWKDMTDAPFGSVILSWAVITFFGVMAAIKLRTTNGLMLGFIITISGALVIFVNISAESLKAKKEITQIEKRLDNLPNQARPLIEPQQAKQPHDTMLNVSTLEKERDQLLALVEAGSILTNFSSMTLGGLGAGLLTSAALSRRNREEELEIETPGRKSLLKILLYIFSYAAISSITTGVGIYTLFLVRWIAVYPMISDFTTALIGFALSLPIAVIGYTLAYISLQTKDLKLPGSLLTALLMLLLYVNSMSTAVFFASSWILLFNASLILAFKKPRAWIYQNATKIIRMTLRPRS
ncbi:hypothetical protein RZ910_000051 [Pseudomonas aeruginosa]|nr:hypothetical protein [Pseudomonas aeruginosa]MDG3759828.1 hypothetical protein [Pseudomonas aeruginosa]MDG4268156.1 hypothetical protein [Pseudomonas aeruginosa]